MTYEEAKRILNPDTVDEAFLMACEALDKQIPEPPLDIRACPNEAKFAYCQVCGQVVDEWSPYCDQCGQAIDWEG